jgi:nitrogenase cofactor biosynthesis protein NifB
LDATLDAHKYNALGRAAIFGDPDFVFGLTRQCAENGLVPAVAATGSQVANWEESILSEIVPAASAARHTKNTAKDEADFDLIERLSLENEVNLLVGSSEGRRLAEKRNLPLCRRAFPIHDRQGGARIRLYGFEGAMETLDALANAIREREEVSFRGRLKKAHFTPLEASIIDAPMVNAPVIDAPIIDAPKLEALKLEEPDIKVAPVFWAETPLSFKPLGENLAGGAVYAFNGVRSFDAALNDQKDGDLKPFRPAYGLPMAEPKGEIHPCFSLEAAHLYSRLHLPVAPACNLNCRYCQRDFDCVNESRPGVTSQILTPREALERFLEFRAQTPDLKVVGVAGPGESLANFAEVAETFRLIKRADPDMALCLSTNGLLLPFRVRELADLGVRHLSVTVNAINPSTGAEICQGLNYLGRSYQGIEAAALLLANQLGGIKMAAELGLKVKVNTVVLKNLNAGEAAPIHKEVARLGAFIGNVMKHIPVKGSDLANLPQISGEDLARISWECQAHLPQTRHCRQCRADAAGRLNEDLSYRFRKDAKIAVSKAAKIAPLKAPPEPKTPRPLTPGWVKVAVVSKSGAMVDRHFGQAERYLVYESDGLNSRLLENRAVDFGEGKGPCGFIGLKDPLASQKPEGFIVRLVVAVADCDAVVATRFGQSPKDKLKARGIAAISSFDAVDAAVLSAAKEALSQRALADGAAAS